MPKIRKIAIFDNFGLLYLGSALKNSRFSFILSGKTSFKSLALNCGQGGLSKMKAKNA